MRRTPARVEPGAFARQALEDRVVLGIDRQQLAAARVERGAQQRPGHHDRFLVREQQALAGARGRERRFEPGGADDRRDDGVAAGSVAASISACAPAATRVARRRSAQALAQLRFERTHRR